MEYRSPGGTVVEVSHPVPPATDVHHGDAGRTSPAPAARRR
ncbi:MAG TPA: hypothetical protein VM388_03675 [Acidimicrobiales bacterium]|nr:hypothetical protein [Acidimicrobiales bacterium]